MTRMKNNMIRRREGRLAGLILLGMAVFLGGCSLAREERQEALGPDRLIGAYITREYLDLFDMEGYLNNHAGLLEKGSITVGPGQGEEYRGRIYAALEKKDGQGTPEYVFEGIEGIPFFMPLVKSEDGSGEDLVTARQGPEISDAHFTSGNSIKLEGVIYYSGKDSPQFYCNPVYQCPDGSVYLTAGTGVSGQMASGVSLNMQLSETYTVSSADGQQDRAGELSSDAEDGQRETRSEVSITIQGKDVGSKCTIIQMDENNRVIKETSAEGPKASGVLKIEDETSYIIAEYYSQEDESAERELFNLGEDENYISIYTQAPDGIVMKQEIAAEKRQHS